MSVRAANENFTVQAGGYSARLIPLQSNALFDACLQLRYRYFVQERGWVAPEACPNGLEHDDYDESAFHLAVFCGNETLAYMRILPHQPNLGFMLDAEFSPLLSEEERRVLPREEAVELSRLVCCPSLPRIREQGPHPVELLLKLLYRFSLAHGFERFYIVVEESWIKPFARRFGLAFTPLGAPYIFPDGTRTVAATATLTELQESMKAHSLAKYEWYHSF